MIKATGIIPHEIMIAITICHRLMKWSWPAITDNLESVELEETLKILEDEIPDVWGWCVSIGTDISNFITTTTIW